MYEITFIAPYEELYDMVKKVIKQKGFNNIRVVLGDLRNGLKEAGKAVDMGTNIIISRGGTYKLIKEEMNVTVVELQISAYDIVKSIKNILDVQKPIAIIGYDNIIHGYNLLVGTKGMNLHRYTIGSNKTVLDIVRKCLDDGIHTFLGDTIVRNVCLKLGYPCYMIESSEESVLLAITRAQEILEGYKNQLEQNKRYTALIDVVRDGVLATDQNYRISAFNSVAEDILGVKKEDVIGRDMKTLFNASEITEALINKNTIIDEIKNVNGKKINLSSVPIVVNGKNKGAVAIFQDINMLQNLERNVRAKLNEKGFTAKYTFDKIIHSSKVINQCIEVGKRYSQYDATVLITGPTGVGKELFAQSIHNASKRKLGPFVAVNCAALPKSLIESELFGYAEGAFTGSKRGGKEGMFELAHKGSIFLDEISELPVDIQGRLLRVLQEHEVMRVGDSKVIPLDIRIICATNKDLYKMVEEGRFREDLLYRINVLPLQIPKLNERMEDIEPLAVYFLEKYNKSYNKNIKFFTPKAIQFLKEYQYNGNVRELEGMIERAVIICENDMINHRDFVLDKGHRNSFIQVQDDDVFKMKEEISLKELENQYIDYIYNKTGKSVTKTSDILKINRTTLWRKINKDE